MKNEEIILKEDSYVDKETVPGEEEYKSFFFAFDDVMEN